MIFGADVAGAVAVFVLIPITIQRRAQPATPETTIAIRPLFEANCPDARLHIFSA